MLLLSKYYKPLVIYLFLFKNIIYSQTNLIQNSSFEKYTNPIDCPNGSFEIGGFPTNHHVVDNWYTYNSPDYYNSICSNTTISNVPQARFGDSYAKHGNAYAGIIAFAGNFETKEYVYQNLQTPLIADSVYCLSFFITKADRVTHAIKNLGAYFSVNLPSLVSYINATPQVVNSSGFISDTINWVEIQGCFTAQGGEQYITIGNFNSNANTDTLNVGCTNQLFGTNKYAYYYIDSVSLWQNNFPTSINEFKKENEFSIFPNPTNNICTISSKTIIQKTEVTNIAGQVLLSEIVNEKTHQLQLHNFSQGIYFIKVYYPNGLSVTKKVIVNP